MVRVPQCSIHATQLCPVFPLWTALLDVELYGSRSFLSKTADVWAHSSFWQPTRWISCSSSAFEEHLSSSSVYSSRQPFSKLHVAVLDTTQVPRRLTTWSFELIKDRLVLIHVHSNHYVSVPSHFSTRQTHNAEAEVMGLCCSECSSGWRKR